MRMRNYFVLMALAAALTFLVGLMPISSWRISGASTTRIRTSTPGFGNVGDGYNSLGDRDAGQSRAAHGQFRRSTSTRTSSRICRRSRPSRPPPFLFLFYSPGRFRIFEDRDRRRHEPRLRDQSAECDGSVDVHRRHADPRRRGDELRPHPRSHEQQRVLQRRHHVRRRHPAGLDPGRVAQRLDVCRPDERQRDGHSGGLRAPGGRRSSRPGSDAGARARRGAR